MLNDLGVKCKALTLFFRHDVYLNHRLSCIHRIEMLLGDNYKLTLTKTKMVDGYPVQTRVGLYLIPAL